MGTEMGSASKASCFSCINWCFLKAWEVLALQLQRLHRYRTILGKWRDSTCRRRSVLSRKLVTHVTHFHCPSILAMCMAISGVKGFLLPGRSKQLCWLFYRWWWEWRRCYLLMLQSIFFFFSEIHEIGLFFFSLEQSHFDLVDKNNEVEEDVVLKNEKQNR